MKKTKYKIPTSIGLITRTSAREYAYVVVASVVRSSQVERAHQWHVNHMMDSLSYFKKQAANNFAEMTIHSSDTPEYIARQKAETLARITALEQELCDAPAALAKKLAERAQLSDVLGFASRLDLAQIVATKPDNVAAWEQIEIVEILPEHKD